MKSDPRRLQKNKESLMIKPVMTAIIVSGLVFVIYLTTMAPTVIWGDSAKLATFVENVELSCRLEYHPLHTVIGMAFNKLPIGNCAYRINLVSAVFGALTIGVLFMVLFLWTKSYLPTLGAALAMAVSHVFWLLSVMTESYTIFTFLMVTMLLLVVLWDEKKSNLLIYLTAFVFGLSLSNNLLMPFVLPALLYFYFSSRERPSLNLSNYAWIIFSVLLGSSLMIYLFAESVASTGSEMLDLFTGGPFKRYYRSPIKIATEMAIFPGYLMYQFPIIGFLLGLLGGYHQYKSNRRKFIFLFLIIIIDILFATGYMRQKQFYLMLPAFIAYSVYIAMGLVVISNWAININSRKYIAPAVVACLIMLPIGLYHSMPMLTKVLNIDLVKARTLTYRDNTRFFLVPSKHNELGAERFGKEVFDIVEPNSIVIADFTPIAVLRYFQQVENVRKDVYLKLVDFQPLKQEFVEKHIQNRSIYLADDLEPDYSIKILEKNYHLIKVGPLIKVEAKEERVSS